MRDHKRTQHLVFYTRRAFVHTARPFPSFRDIILARTLSTFRISVNMYTFTHSLALSLSRSLDTDGWIPTRVGRERRGRRRAVQTVADISSFVVMSNVTPNVSTSFSLFRSAHIECSRWCSFHFSSSKGSNNSLAAFLRVVLRFEREKYYSSSSRRRKRRRQNHTTQRGKISLRILSGRSKRCLQNASERRIIARDWSKWNTVEVLVDKGAFEGLCSVRLRVVCARFKQRRLVSLSLSLSACVILICTTNTLTR